MLTATADVAVEDPHPLVEALAGHLREQDVPVTREGAELHTHLPMGEAVFRPGAKGLQLEARAADQAEIEAVVAFMATQVREFCVASHPVITWQGAVSPGETYADFRELRVSRVERITPDLRRITFTARDLDRFTDPETPNVRLHFPPEGLSPRWPKAGPDGLPLPVDPAYRPAVRVYALQRVDPEAGEVVIDFALHDARGPGSEWARWARVGDVCGMSGPEAHVLPRADWVLLAGDGSAIGTIARMLAELPATTEGIVLIEVGTAGDLPPMTAPQGIEIRAVVGGAENRAPLAEAVRAVTPPDDRTSFIWVGCEAVTAQVIRRDLQNRSRTSPYRVEVFWTRGVASRG